MGDRAPRQPRVCTLILERHDTRPWPVDPRVYPLSGPSRGPVYGPEADLKSRMVERMYGPRRSLGIAARIAGFIVGLFRPL